MENLVKHRERAEKLRAQIRELESAGEDVPYALRSELAYLSTTIAQAERRPKVERWMAKIQEASSRYELDYIQREARREPGLTVADLAVLNRMHAERVAEPDLPDVIPKENA